MNRERILAVASDIEKNPEGFNMDDCYNCIAGRIVKMFNPGGLSSPDTIAHHFNLSQRDAGYVFWGNFSSKRDRHHITPNEAVTFLRTLAS